MDSINPTEHGKAHKKNVSVCHVITANVRWFLQQHLMTDNKVLPNLPEHQQKALEKCHHWLDSIWEDVLCSTKDILANVELFELIFDKIRDKIPEMQNGDEEAKQVFKEYLTVFHKDLAEKRDKADGLASKMDSFSIDMAKLTEEFQADYDTALKALEGDKKKIQELKEKQKMYKKKADECIIAMIVECVDVPECIAILALMGVGLNVALFLASADITALATTVAFYVTYMDKINELMIEINSLEEETIELTLIDHQLQTFTSHTTHIKDASKSLRESWDKVESFIKTHLDTLESCSAEQAAEIALQLAAFDWKDIKELVGPFKDGDIGVKTFPNNSEMIKAFKEKHCSAAIID